MKLSVFSILLLLSTLSLAQETTVFKDQNVIIGVGSALVRFNTNVKYTDKQQDRSVFVDAEGTLGLPDVDTIPIFYAGYRFSKAHAIGFSYTQVFRESSIINFSETLGNVAIDGVATFSDKTRFYSIFYANTLFEDDRSQVQVRLGINVLDINYALSANGIITYEDLSVSDSFYKETGVVASLPLLGVNLQYSFTQKWGISTKVDLVGGSFEDTRAFVIMTNVSAQYRFNKNIGLIFGVEYFYADVVIEDSQQRTDVNYGYDGAFLGLHMLF